jgi:HEPN domain-containing protein
MAAPLVPRKLLDPVVEYFKPQRVILFGSRARGEATRDSDIDLLVIVDDDTPPEKLALQAMHDAAKSYPRAADVIPMRAATFERYRNIVGTLAAEADADGIVVYGSPKGSASMKGVDPRARWEAVGRWLAKAEADRRVAANCIAMVPPEPGSAAFHCQQAVEKLLKGFLVLAGKRSRKTHSLTDLGALARPSFPGIADHVTAAGNSSRWAFDFRYPSEDPPAEPDEDELRRAFAVIDALAAQAARGRAAGLSFGLQSSAVPPSRSRVRRSLNQELHRRSPFAASAENLQENLSLWLNKPITRRVSHRHRTPPLMAAIARRCSPSPLDIPI